MFVLYVLTALIASGKIASRPRNEASNQNLLIIQAVIYTRFARDLRYAVRALPVWIAWPSCGIPELDCDTMFESGKLTYGVCEL